MSHYRVDDLRDRAAARDDPYLEFLREASLSAGLYTIPAGTPDRQTPHDEDEVYHVLSGRATFEHEGASYPVGPGDVIYVPGHDEHRFVGVEERLEALVFFAPAEGTARGAGAGPDSG